MKVSKIAQREFSEGTGGPELSEKPVNPKELLSSLKEKARLFAQLKNEGLINQDRHLSKEVELKNAIQDLEILLQQLEVGT